MGEYVKRFILQRQIDTGSARNTKFQALFQAQRNMKKYIYLFKNVKKKYDL